jgi:hypothetical protein
MTLASKAWLSLVALAVVTAAILFVPAGTIDYWQAWLFLVVFIGASAVRGRSQIGGTGCRR